LRSESFAVLLEAQPSSAILCLLSQTAGNSNFQSTQKEHYNVKREEQREGSDKESVETKGSPSQRPSYENQINGSVVIQTEVLTPCGSVAVSQPTLPVKYSLTPRSKKPGLSSDNISHRPPLLDKERYEGRVIICFRMQKGYLSRNIQWSLPSSLQPSS